MKQKITKAFRGPGKSGPYYTREVSAEDKAIFTKLDKAIFTKLDKALANKEYQKPVESRQRRF